MDANIAFMRGGGYAISARLPDVQQPARGAGAAGGGAGRGDGAPCRAAPMPAAPTPRRAAPRRAAPRPPRPPQVLVLWGRQDRILEPAYAQRFVDTLPDARLQARRAGRGRRAARLGAAGAGWARSCGAA